MQPYPQQTKSYLTGLCIGLLPAVAISTASTVVELLPAAIQAVLIAFRTGLRTWEARNFLAQGSEAAALQSWSVVVGLQEAPAKESLEQFCKLKVCSMFFPSGRVQLLTAFRTSLCTPSHILVPYLPIV